MSNSKLKLVGLSLCLTLLTNCVPSSDSIESNTTDSLYATNIYGGVDADTFFQKENGIVGLLMLQRNGQQSICTGSLISKRIVLTAAHCIDSIAAVLVHFTPYISSTPSSLTRFGIDGKIHDVFIKTLSELVKDRQTNPQSTREFKIIGDIALIKLEADAPSDFKLAQLASTTSLLNPSTKFLLTGYGLVSNSMMVKSSTAGTLRKVGDVNFESYEKLDKKFSLKSEGKGVCHGDSGGPAFIQLPHGQLAQAGIASHVDTKQGCSGQHFTSVADYTDWIKKESEVLMNTPPKPTNY